jgi:hypothetical protein
MDDFSELDKAKELIAKAELKNFEDAKTALSEFLETWGNKYGVKLTVAGSFSGSILNTSIDIIKK